MAAAATERLGQIDILLANAGLYIPGDAVAGDPDAWDELLTVNVNSVFRLVNRVLPQMIRLRSGDIVVTSSVSGHQAIQWEPVYSASKHAVQSFVHGVRRQIAPHNVRIGAIAPGMVLNPLWGYADESAIEAKVAAHEGIRSEDVAEAVMFMLTRPPHVTIRDLVMLPQNQDI
jgi:ribitol 2-dehydrogenase